MARRTAVLWFVGAWVGCALACSQEPFRAFDMAKPERGGSGSQRKPSGSSGAGAPAEEQPICKDIPAGAGGSSAEPQPQDSTGDADAGSDACLATCLSKFGTSYHATDPVDPSPLAGRWFFCAARDVAPFDQHVGVEFTADGRMFILVRNCAGQIVRDEANPSSRPFTAKWIVQSGLVDLLFGAGQPAMLQGSLYACPKKLILRSDIRNGVPDKIGEYIFYNEIEPDGCTRPSNGCDFCGRVTCPAGASLGSNCRCVSMQRWVRPLSQTCDFCCGRRCPEGQFLDSDCECY